LAGSLGPEIPFPYFARVLDSALMRIPPVWNSVQDLRDSGILEVVALSNMAKEVWSSLQKKFEIDSLFQSTVLSYEHGLLKPDPRIFRLALRQARTSARESLFVDDTVQNVRAAKSLGLRAYHAKHPTETAVFLKSLIGQ
jgi:HAD superfamily hydrolase (TIGR01509 family)